MSQIESKNAMKSNPGRIVLRIESNPKTGEGDINDVLIKTLAEAHANTNLKLEIVHEMLRKNQVSNQLGGVGLVIHYHYNKFGHNTILRIRDECNSTRAWDRRTCGWTVPKN